WYRRVFQKLPKNDRATVRIYPHYSESDEAVVRGVEDCTKEIRRGCLEWYAVFESHAVAKCAVGPAALFGSSLCQVGGRMMNGQHICCCRFQADTFERYIAEHG